MLDRTGQLQKDEMGRAASVSEERAALSAMWHPNIDGCFSTRDKAEAYLRSVAEYLLGEKMPPNDADIVDCFADNDIYPILARCRVDGTKNADVEELSPFHCPPKAKAANLAA
jgi:hypothetical protein